MHLLPKVFRTEGDVVEFDPSKILDSIIKETHMNESDARNITELVVRRIISSGIKFLSGPHIREIVCSILSEQHFEEARKLYTRIGMPLMDYEEILERGLKNKPGEITNPEKIHHWAADQLAEEYTLLRILDDEESKAHLYGDIHIHKLKYFDLRPLSQAWDARMILKNGLPPVKVWNICCKSGPAENLKSAIYHLAKWLGMTQGEFSGGQGFNFISTFLAPYAIGMTADDILKDIHSFIYEINQLATVIGQGIPITSISCSPEILDFFKDVPAISTNGKIKGTYGDYQDECLKIFDAITNIYIKGDYYGNEYRFPKHIIYVKDDWLTRYHQSYLNIFNEISKREGPYIINLFTNWLYEEIKEQYTKRSFNNFGTLQNISLNLPRYAYTGKNIDDFIEILRNKMHMCSRVFKKKREIIKKRLNSKHLPLCSSNVNENENLFNIEKQNFAFNCIGLNEAIKFLIGYELHENSEAFNLGLKIINEMKNISSELSNEQNMNYIIQENFSLKTLYRFARLDLKHFSEIAIPQKNNLGHYYTNSTHFKKSFQMDIVEKLDKQGQFHEIIKNGRNIEYISKKNIQEDKRDFIGFLKQICENSQISCVKFDN